MRGKKHLLQHDRIQHVRVRQGVDPICETHSLVSNVAGDTILACERGVSILHELLHMIQIYGNKCISNLITTRYDRHFSSCDEN